MCLYMYIVFTVSQTVSCRCSLSLFSISNCINVFVWHNNTIRKHNIIHHANHGTCNQQFVELGIPSYINCFLPVERNDTWNEQFLHIIWAPSSEFVSSSIPSWHILTAHAQPFRGARDLAFCLKVSLDSLLVWASSGGSGETARMRRLAWTFAARIGGKYQIRLTRSIYFNHSLVIILTW